jgi:hypothetical protein
MNPYPHQCVHLTHLQIKVIGRSSSRTPLTEEGRNNRQHFRAMAAGLQVFGQPASTDVARVMTCLFEKNLEFELVRIDTFKRSHKLPEFIKLRVSFHYPLFISIDLFALCRQKFGKQFDVFFVPAGFYRAGDFQAR